MYYYILESASKKSESFQEKVKNLLGDLGIAGETVSPSPARSIEELASLGIVKGYSTIVAVGSEKLVNKIATAIINKKENNDVVLGIIPDDYTSPIAKKIHVKDLKDACETLKYRKLETTDACFIEPNKYFLTEAVIESAKPTEGYLLTADIQSSMIFNRIVIKPGIEIRVEDSLSNENKKSVFSFLFGKKEVSENSSSFFHAKRFQIETPGQVVPILADGEIIAKTPIIIQNRPKVLKIIVARDILIPDGNR
ncbi:TPA: hypothetical protein DD449_01295 [Candidatus Berkelbacteria bacterium]|uniref:DAGKc domain-containing protein n=1 Tax=Berkelbacteria bacterium GW2011_GWE1_39_12 TaxID=1618337 RepID=A0A0G4B3S5_9BACT|nr:MAG: hypothetical protein UT28_C0001G0828 [Berkelbacteria bacterium GW2011_GWE1_39_12]HBO60306.1 hypothetical protein [Candidatus Berkelbacteria bacterium]